MLGAALGIAQQQAAQPAKAVKARVLTGVEHRVVKQAACLDHIDNGGHVIVVLLANDRHQPVLVDVKLRLLQLSR